MSEKAANPIGFRTFRSRSGRRTRQPTAIGLTKSAKSAEIVDDSGHHRANVG
jgi:hypothetical protein